MTGKSVINPIHLEILTELNQFNSKISPVIKEKLDSNKRKRHRKAKNLKVFRDGPRSNNNNDDNGTTDDDDDTLVIPKKKTIPAHLSRGVNVGPKLDLGKEGVIRKLGSEFIKEAELIVKAYGKTVDAVEAKRLIIEAWTNMIGTLGTGRVSGKLITEFTIRAFKGNVYIYVGHMYICVIIIWIYISY